MTTRARRPLLVSVGVALVLGGGGLLLHPYVRSDALPYAYVLVEAGKPRQFPQFPGLEAAGKNLTVHKYELRQTADNRTISTLFTAREEGRARVVLDYKTELSVPALTLPVRHETFQPLYEEILRHTTADAVFVAWWDHSLRINLFTGRAVLLGEHLGEPVFVPEAWRRSRRAIREAERKFWGADATDAARATFEKVRQAFLAPEEEGHRLLRQLTGARPAYVVVDQGDVLKLAESAGERFRVEFEEIPFDGNTHGAVKRVRDGLKQRAVRDYAVEPIGEKAVRVYYLTRPEDADRLLVKLLPFTSSNPFKLTRFKLRLQQSTLWVYEMA